MSPTLQEHQDRWAELFRWAFARAAEMDGTLTALSRVEEEQMPAPPAGTQVKHARKRRRGVMTRLGGSGELAVGLSSGRVTPWNPQWRPWSGHAQVSRERTPEMIRQNRQEVARQLGVVASPSPSLAEMAAGNRARRRGSQSARRYKDARGRRRA